MTVNPKKMRPYDQPPKRRRTLIPDGPDSAAAGFLVAAAIWFVIATGIGLLAIGLRLVTFELSIPLGLFDLSFELDQRRVDAAFANATVFGWLSNAGFAAIAFMTPRLLGRRMVGEKLMNLGLAMWNLALAGGIGLLYVFDLGVNGPLTALPWFVEGGLATGALIVTGVFLATAGTSLRTGYISLWFAGIALLGLLGMTSLAAGLGILDAFFGLDGVPVGLASAFIGRVLMTLWLLGMTYAILHYVVPRAAGQPLASGGIALLTWISWLLLAPLAGLAVLLDASVPYFVTSAGAMATMLLLLPASLAAVNLSLTMNGRWSLLFGRGTAAFAAVSVAFLLGHTLLEAIGALRSVTVAVGPTDWSLGVFLWAAYGTVTLAALALADHAIPRVMRRSWSGGPLAGATLWLAFGGAALAGMALMFGGMAEGSLLAGGAAPDAIMAGTFWYRAVAFLGIGLSALAGFALLGTLFLAYTSGEPADYVVPGQAGAAAAGH
ncbi:MAG TPA: cbb3-type cytochrome c oxidase subunit I [Candidatus Angelobacter sp.]|nr:cbb3-type cytochrome c oxidase subunit I [Candidatus Angelobacter sp.]